MVYIHGAIFTIPFDVQSDATDVPSYNETITALEELITKNQTGLGVGNISFTGEFIEVDSDENNEDNEDLIQLIKEEVQEKINKLSKFVELPELKAEDLKVLVSELADNSLHIFLSELVNEPGSLPEFSEESQVIQPDELKVVSEIETEPAKAQKAEKIKEEEVVVILESDLDLNYNDNPFNNQTFKLDYEDII